ncbi:MAG: hypothetical protein WCP20_20395 [Desulfuromonadales bacterium]
MKLCFRIISCVALIFVAISAASADDWRIFGIHGTVQMTPKGGNQITLSNDKSLMMTVSVGSTIRVKGKGKLVLVSLKSRQAFEIGDDSTALVDPDIIRAQSGSVNTRAGISLPSGKDGKMGGIVMRGTGNRRSCLNALSLKNTAILAVTPELRWENRCNGLSRVNLTLLSDEGIVHSAENISGSSYRMPENVLKVGNRYLWMVDGGASFDMTSGVFIVAGGRERDAVLQRMKDVESATNPEERLAYIYFLSDSGFSEMAHEEGKRLRAAFPDASALGELP